MNGYQGLWQTYLVRPRQSSYSDSTVDSMMRMRRCLMDEGLLEDW